MSTPETIAAINESTNAKTSYLILSFELNPMFSHFISRVAAGADTRIPDDFNVTFRVFQFKSSKRIDTFSASIRTDDCFNTCFNASHYPRVCSVIIALPLQDIESIESCSRYDNSTIYVFTAVILLYYLSAALFDFFNTSDNGKKD